MWAGRRMLGGKAKNESGPGATRIQQVVLQALTGGASRLPARRDAGNFNSRELLRLFLAFFLLGFRSGGGPFLLTEGDEISQTG